MSRLAATDYFDLNFFETDEKRLGTAFEFALAHPDRVRFAVAQIDSEVIGTVALCDAYSTWQASPYGTIEDFYVMPDARGKGVGTVLPVHQIDGLRFGRLVEFPNFDNAAITLKRKTGQ